MTKSQKIRRFHALLAKTKMMYAKPAMLAGQGVESTKDLTSEQLDTLIDYLLDLVIGKNKDADKEVRTWRHKVLRMVAECGVNTNDWNEVNAFLLDKRVAGKHLYEITDIEELKKLHRKLFNISSNIKKTPVANC